MKEFIRELAYENNVIKTESMLLTTKNLKHSVCTIQQIL